MHFDFSDFDYHITTSPYRGWQTWTLVSPDGVAPSRMVGVSAFVNLPLHQKVQKFSSGTGSPEWSRKKGRKTAVVVTTTLVYYCNSINLQVLSNLSASTTKDQ